MRHLVGTHSLLEKWCQSHETCIAGLFHAVYGPQGLREGLDSADQRSMVIDLIGRDAENLVYLYCACDKARFCVELRENSGLFLHNRFTDSVVELELDSFRAICAIMAANEMDLAFTGYRSVEFFPLEILELINLFAAHAGLSNFLIKLKRR